MDTGRQRKAAHDAATAAKTGIDSASQMLEGYLQSNQLHTVRTDMRERLAEAQALVDGVITWIACQPDDLAAKH
jgi:hypothetical protein